MPVLDAHHDGENRMVAQPECIRHGTALCMAGTTCRLDGNPTRQKDRSKLPRGRKVAYNPHICLSCRLIHPGSRALGAQSSPLRKSDFRRRYTGRKKTTTGKG